MATAKSKSDLITDADSFLPDNITEEISPGDVRDRVKDLASSMLNIIDGGLVVTQLTGYASALTPSDDKHFTNKKYVDDAVAAVSPVWGSITGTLTNQTDLTTYLSTNYQPLAANLTSLSGLSYASTSFVKMTAAGTFALDTNTYASASDLTSYAKLDGTNQPFTGNIQLQAGGAFKSITIDTGGGLGFFGLVSGATYLWTVNSAGAETHTGTRLPTFNLFSTDIIRLRRQNTSGSWLNTPFVFDLTNSVFNASGVLGAKNGIITDGGIKIANNTQTAATAGAGSIKYDSGFYGSDGANWNLFATSADLSSYAKLDGSNQPFTGDIRLEKANPFLYIRSTTNSTSSLYLDSNYTGTSTSNANFAIQAGGTPQILLYRGSSFGTLKTTIKHDSLAGGFTAIGGQGGVLIAENLGYGAGYIWVKSGQSLHPNTTHKFMNLSNADRVVINTGDNINNLVSTYSIKIGNTTQTAASAGAGSIKYDSGLQISDASNWEKALTSPTSNVKVTAAAPYTNDGYIEVRINGTLIKLMTTA